MQSLVKSNPKRALDTQYDKRKVFMTIIDRWSDRLKRNFKHFYQRRSNPPEDFNENILQSKWRTDFVNSTKIFQQIPSLHLQGPNFIVGSPDPLFSENRMVLWTDNYDVEVVVYEMMVWFDYIKEVLKFVYVSDDYEYNHDHPEYVYDSISQQVYSRGDSTEQVMFDTWTALSHWIDKSRERSKY